MHLDDADAFVVGIVNKSIALLREETERHQEDLKLKLKEEGRQRNTAIRNLFDCMSEHTEEQEKLRAAFERRQNAKLATQDDVVDLLACELRREASKKSDL